MDYVTVIMKLDRLFRYDEAFELLTENAYCSFRA